jgi:hypothetical protein
MIALYVDSCIVPGFVLSWQGAPPQYCARCIWDCVGFYTMHTLLNPLVESQFESFLKLIILFGITHNTITFNSSESYLMSLRSRIRGCTGEF